MKETAHAETMTTPSSRAGRDDAARRRLFVMRCGARLFAVYADEVEATSENLMPTPLPFAPAPVRGVVSQRGRILTLIDPLTLLPRANLDGAPATATGRNVDPPATPARAPFVVALKGDEQLALSVDGIEHEVELYDDEAGTAAATTTDASGNSLLRRTIPYHTHATIALINPARLFDAAMQGVERRRQRT